jgi:hypothetical protein
MTPTLARDALADTVLSLRLQQELIRQRAGEIRHSVLATSRYIREPNFTAIHPRDLQFLFSAYDDRFFGRLCKQTLDGRRLRFRLSPRLIRAAGKTTRFTSPAGEVSYEIAIASSILFDGFGKTDRPATVGGLTCEDRLEALQRVSEHEMVHLSEQLCWESTDCAASRFQDIARRFFLHQGHTHDLVTRRERAAKSGIRVGSWVTFGFEGRRLTGRVNRITKRATVLVPDIEGQKYSDGLRYKTYYVPIAHLSPTAASPSVAQKPNEPSANHDVGAQ